MSMMFSNNRLRPNKLQGKKDKKYHSDYAKFCLSTMDNYIYRRYVNKCLVNWYFFKGGDGQWIFDEDIESFFLDESGDVRNRLKWTKNVIKPMVQQYVGNAIRMDYSAKANCISDFVINRREEELNKLKNAEQLAQEFPELEGAVRDEYPIGDTPLETEEIFNNAFVGEYEETLNNLLNFVAEDIDLESIKVNITRNLSICGLGIYKGYEANEVYKGESINPLFFGWDMSSVKPDLSDSEYMFEWYYMDSPSILERYQNLSKKEREAIENYSRNESQNSVHKIVNNVYTIPGSKIPVYEVYWKDIEKREYGWVEDSFGYPYYTMINDPESEYTDKDLIKPPTDSHQERMGDKKKETIYVDVMRFCIIIPQEEIGNGSGDIILDYGMMPYQEKELYDPANVKFPYKCYTWVYDRGEILTPLDDVIDPQRFLNRTISVVESQMSNMRGSGTVISKSAVDDRDAESDVVRNINSSKPIFVDTDRVGSVQNAIGTYGTNIGPGTLQMFQVIQSVQQSIQDVTGVNEAMTGTQGGGDVLVGVIEAQIQRGSLVQEPFYWALTSILKQAYQHIATVGKAVYFDNPRRLAMIVGDKGLDNITITEDNLMQDYRVFVDRSEAKGQALKAGDQLLFTLLQSGLIDPLTFSNLMGRATPEMVAKALREFQADKAMAEQKSAQASNQGLQAQQMQEAQQMQQIEGMQEEQEMAQAQIMDTQHEQNMQEIALKEQSKLEREEIKNTQ